MNSINSTKFNIIINFNRPNRYVSQQWKYCRWTIFQMSKPIITIKEWAMGEQVLVLGMLMIFWMIQVRKAPNLQKWKFKVNLKWMKNLIKRHLIKFLEEKSNAPKSSQNSWKSQKLKEKVIKILQTCQKNDARTFLNQWIWRIFANWTIQVCSGKRAKHHILISWCVVPPELENHPSWICSLKSSNWKSSKRVRQIIEIQNLINTIRAFLRILWLEE